MYAILTMHATTYGAQEIQTLKDWKVQNFGS